MLGITMWDTVDTIKLSSPLCPSLSLSLSLSLSPSLSLSLFLLLLSVDSRTDIGFHAMPSNFPLCVFVCANQQQQLPTVCVCACV